MSSKTCLGWSENLCCPPPWPWGDQGQVAGVRSWRPDPHLLNQRTLAAEPGTSDSRSAGSCRVCAGRRSTAWKDARLYSSQDLDLLGLNLRLAKVGKVGESPQSNTSVVCSDGGNTLRCNMLLYLSPATINGSTG